MMYSALLMTASCQSRSIELESNSAAVANTELPDRHVQALMHTHCQGKAAVRQLKARISLRWSSVLHSSYPFAPVDHQSSSDSLRIVSRMADLTIFSRLAHASGASSATSLAALSSSAFNCALRVT